MAHHDQHGFVAAIDKPYTLDELQGVIGAILGASG